MKSILLDKKLLGLVEITFGLVNASFSLVNLFFSFSIKRILHQDKHFGTSSKSIRFLKDLLVTVTSKGVTSFF